MAGDASDDPVITTRPVVTTRDNKAKVVKASPQRVRSKNNPFKAEPVPLQQIHHVDYSPKEGGMIEYIPAVTLDEILRRKERRRKLRQKSRRAAMMYREDI